MHDYKYITYEDITNRRFNKKFIEESFDLKILAMLLFHR